MALGFAELQNLHRRTHRAETNPLDRCTVFSIYPREIHERKITVTPGDFIIPPGSYDKPGRLTIESSSWWKDTGPDDPLIEIPVGSAIMAKSICDDWMKGLLGCNMIDAKPGLFWVPGEVSVETLKKDMKGALDKARRDQNKYYSNLITMADSLWARTNGNPLAIPGDSKLAAQELGLDKEWLKHVSQAEAIRCVACGNMRMPQFPVCPHCKMVVDSDRAKALGIKFAE